MKKQPHVTAMTRQNLVRAFWTLYQSKKIEHISVKEITHIAGYNRSTFYEYFADIYGVLDYLEDTLLNEIKESVMSSLISLDQGQAIQRIADMYESKGEYLSVLLSEDGNPHFARKFKNVMKPALYAFFPLRQDDSYAVYIYEFAMSAMIGTLTYWYQHQSDIPSSEIVSLVRSMLSRGALQEMQKHA